MSTLSTVGTDDSHHAKNQIDASLERPLYDPKAKREIPTYVLVQRHPSSLLPVAKDKRTRTGPEWQQHFEPFTEDVRAHGVLQPIIAVSEGEAARVVDGETRRMAALLAGLDSIPILVYECELTESQLVIAQLTANAKRRDFTELELALIYCELMQLNGWNQAQLARNIHVHPAQVSKVLAISKNLCPEVQAMVMEGLAPRAGYAISRLPDIPAQIDLAKQVRDGIISVEGAEHRVQTILSGGKRQKPKEKPWIIELANATASIKGDLLQGAEALLARLQELVKALKKRGDDPLAGLVN